MIAKECPRLLPIKLASDLWVVYCTVKWSDKCVSTSKMWHLVLDIPPWNRFCISFIHFLPDWHIFLTEFWLSKETYNIKLYKVLVIGQLKPWKALCGLVTEVACHWEVTFYICLINSGKKNFFFLSVLLPLIQNNNFEGEPLVQIFHEMVIQKEERIGVFFFTLLHFF